MRNIWCWLWWVQSFNTMSCCFTIRFCSSITQYRPDASQAPVSGNCPLQLHKYQKGLNKLLQVLKLVSSLKIPITHPVICLPLLNIVPALQHPFIHPIVKVEYLVDHKFLLMIQPQRYFGSLKDLIYNVSIGQQTHKPFPLLYYLLYRWTPAPVTGLRNTVILLEDWPKRKCNFTDVKCLK